MIVVTIKYIYSFDLSEFLVNLYTNLMLTQIAMSLPFDQLSFSLSAKPNYLPFLEISIDYKQLGSFKHVSG